MGLCLSYDQEEKKAKARSDDIDRQLDCYAKQDKNVIKLLLLGAGESGKSTLVKQMKIIHNDGFTELELLSFKPAVLDNLLSSMKVVLNGMGLLRINLDNPKNRVAAEILLRCHKCCDDNENIFPQVANALKMLWHDTGVRRAVSRGYEYELNDSAIYYFENMDRLCSEKFCPTQTDVLRARVRTQGIIETCFKTKDLIFRMFDVGGQRSERRKWIQCFDDVRSILFVAALSGYDMTLYEDPSVNRMEESLRLFRQICNSVYFRKTSMILFLNKMDLFRDKVLYSGRHLKYYFHGFKGADCDVESAALYVRSMFLVDIPYQHRIVYPHFTTATDTTNVAIVFQAVMDTIIWGNLHAANIL